MKTMRLGLISDIHADLGALDAALGALVERRVDRIVCAGDVVEKGPDGDAVVPGGPERFVVHARAVETDST